MKFVVEGLCFINDIDNEVRRIGEYETLEEAVTAAKQTISNFLSCESRPGMQPKRLVARYQNFGPVPYIFRGDVGESVDVPGFNHFQYAITVSEELCKPQKG